MANDYSGKFVSVRPVGSSGSYTDLPAPSSYKMTSSTLVNSGRNVNGYVVGEVKRSGVRSLEVSWNFLTQAQFTLIASFFDTNFYFECKYFDTITGTYQTKTMYVSDRPSDTAQIQVSLDGNGNITAIKGYVNTQLSIIEV